ncbi:hypothetical protein L484_022455 [Morus notabilis]|uniref:Uncharacterized protein n=1 Tax=Morus notabilis TaxID=981085 RepID=W9QSF9_9ROSA|nr:hypothetical protein L484_022455 [Morus notabilis]
MRGKDVLVHSWKWKGLYMWHMLLASLMALLVSVPFMRCEITDMALVFWIIAVMNSYAYDGIGNFLLVTVLNLR